MNAIHSTLRFVLLFSFALSGAACSSGTLARPAEYTQTRDTTRYAYDRRAWQTSSLSSRVTVARR